MPDESVAVKRSGAGKARVASPCPAHPELLVPHSGMGRVPALKLHHGAAGAYWGRNPWPAGQPWAGMAGDAITGPGLCEPGARARPVVDRHGGHSGRCRV